MSRILGGSWEMLKLSLLTQNTQSGNYTLAAADRGSIVQFTGAAASTITLPNAAAVGSGWWCYLKHSGTGTTAAAKRLAINGMLDGVVNTAVYPGDTRIIQSDGTNLTSVLLVGGFLAVEASDSPFTYTVPSGTVTHDVAAYGGGGGGGAGALAAILTATSGGGGGGGGSSRRALFPSSVLGASVTVTVGATGVGGTPPGGNGTQGGNSTFGPLLYGWAGGGGSGGSITASAGGGGAGPQGVGGNASGATGGAGAIFGAPGGSGVGSAYQTTGAGGGTGGALGAVGFGPSFSSLQSFGGASGGGVSAENATFAGGDVYASNSAAGVAGGVAPGGSGTATPALVLGTTGSQGGTGGASATVANGGAGAAGQLGGGGGGGGGATQTGFIAGAGGNGGGGIVLISYGP